MIAGDFNKRKIAKELKEFTDIKVVQTGPTRGKNTLDLVFTNFPNYIREFGTLPALFNAEGTESDHAAVHLCSRMPRVPEYEIEKYTYIKHTSEGDESFAKYLGEVDWTELTEQNKPDKMVEILHAVFKEGMDISYKTITTTRKNTQPQWINQAVLDLIDQRRAVFRREGRSDTWKELKKKTRSIIKRRKNYFNKKKREKMLAADSLSFHACVKSIVTDEKKKAWTPKNMYPKLPPQIVAEKCAEFFNSISSEYEPLKEEDIPSTFESNNTLNITPKLVENEIRKGKKPKSRVPGDIFIGTLVKNLSTLAPIIATIYSRIVDTGIWPKLWLTEYVTIIPKGNSPDEPSKCRNISCTNFLSKVLERIVLNYARKEVKPKANQFGGEKNCSTNHFLAEVWDQLTEHLEDSRAAVALTSIDYSKAFNRLDHAACLRAFANSGASNQLLRLLTSFLRGRHMTVKVDGHFSKLRTVNAGAPQGSVLGTYIFNVGTDALEEDIDQEEPRLIYELNEGDLAFLELTPMWQTPTHSTPEKQAGLPPNDTSPITTQQNFSILPTARNVPPVLTSRIEPTWRPKRVSVKKFVDDNLSNEKVFMKDIPTIETDEEYYKNARAGQFEKMFRHITNRAEKQGLKVNAEKTSLLAISASTTYRAKTHIYDNQNKRIDCSETLKALGFIFNQEADVKDQIECLCRRFRSRTWALRDLRKAGLSEDELLTVYKTTIRPVIEYSSVIYHPMLTEDQTSHIEKQQVRALKNIYGNDHSQRKLLELSNLPTLKQRREEACLRFAKKTAANDRFAHHFKQRRARPRAEQEQVYVELNARTNRRKNSPFFYYRRILNESVVRY